MTTGAAAIRGRRRPPSRTRSASALGLFFVAAGVNHFVAPRAYRKIVPPGFGDPGLLVAVSGVAEIAGGLAALVPATRRASGWGLMALLVAVFPANIHMARHPEAVPGLRVPRVLLWLRLPLQPLMVWWAWAATHPSR
jgi:uncharacterized membrane protein